MSDFEVQSSSRRYTVHFPERFEDALAARLEKGDVVLMDARVADIHGDRLAVLGDDPRHLRLDATEQLKSYEGIGPIIEHLAHLGFRKNNRLIGIGGGIIQDVTGFTSSILYRGVEWILFPTTLLSQCDSCIGSKTSINFGRFKNQLGNFYPPAEVYVDLSLLRSLPKSELLSGLGEMAHYYLVSGEVDFDRFAREAPAALGNEEILKGLIARSLEIKRRFIEIDEFDQKERQVLNYGHSFGHALETVTGYGLPHGIAVSYGMDIANYISSRMGMIPSDVRNRIRAVLEHIWHEHPLGDVSVPRLLEAVGRDKKNVGATLGLILTRGIGRMFKQQMEGTTELEVWLRDYFQTEVAHG